MAAASLAGGPVDETSRRPRRRRREKGSSTSSAAPSSSISRAGAKASVERAGAAPASSTATASSTIYDASLRAELAEARALGLDAASLRHQKELLSLTHEIAKADDLVAHCEDALRLQHELLSTTRVQLVEADAAASEMREAKLRSEHQTAELQMLLETQQALYARSQADVASLEARLAQQGAELRAASEKMNAHREAEAKAFGERRRIWERTVEEWLASGAHKRIDPIVYHAVTQRPPHTRHAPDTRPTHAHRTPATRPPCAHARHMPALRTHLTLRSLSRSRPAQNKDVFTRVQELLAEEQAQREAQTALLKAASTAEAAHQRMRTTAHVEHLSAQIAELGEKRVAFEDALAAALTAYLKGELSAKAVRTLDLDRTRLPPPPPCLRPPTSSQPRKNRSRAGKRERGLLRALALTSLPPSSPIACGSTTVPCGRARARRQGVA